MFESSTEETVLDSEVEWQEERDSHEMALKMMDARLAIFLAMYHDPRQGMYVPLEIAENAKDVTDELFGFGLTTDKDDEEEGE